MAGLPAAEKPFAGGQQPKVLKNAGSLGDEGTRFRVVGSENMKYINRDISQKAGVEKKSRNKIASAPVICV